MQQQELFGVHAQTTGLSIHVDYTFDKDWDSIDVLAYPQWSKKPKESGIWTASIPTTHSYMVGELLRQIWEGYNSLDPGRQVPKRAERCLQDYYEDLMGNY